MEFKSGNHRNQWITPGSQPQMFMQQVRIILGCLNNFLSPENLASVKELKLICNKILYLLIETLVGLAKNNRRYPTLLQHHQRLAQG